MHCEPMQLEETRALEVQFGIYARERSLDFGDGTPATGYKEFITHTFQREPFVNSALIPSEFC